MTAPFTTYNPTAWANGSLGGSPLSAANLNNIESGIANAYALLAQNRTTPTAIKTATYNPAIGDFALYSASTANIVNSLPKATVGARIRVKKLDSTAYTVAFNVASGDQIDGNATSLTLRYAGETRTLMGIAGGWYVIDGVNTLSSLDSRYLTQTAADARYTAIGPVCVARQTTQVSLTSGQYTQMTWQVNEIDTNAMHSTSTNTSRLTVPTGWGGTYRFTGEVNITAATTTAGRRGAFWYKNGTLIVGGSGGMVPGTASADSHAVISTRLLALVPGDYIELYAYQDSGSALTTYVGGSFASVIQAEYVRP